MPGRYIRVLRRFGHRGSVLFGFGLIACAYGTGILMGYRPTFTEALHVPVFIFGVAFLTLGLFSFTGAPSRNDSFQFAIATAATSAWGLIISTHWTAPVGWTAAVSWFGISMGLFLASAWPNAPRRVRTEELELPDIEALVKGDDVDPGGGR